MRNSLNVTFNLDRLHCYDEADGWGSAEPYMWTIFFKIDGSTCRLNESLMLEGTATVFLTPGSHGNLGDTDVDEGDDVSVPSAIGYQVMTLSPIPVPDFVKASGVDDVAAVAGCIVVLMEEDNVSDAGAESGHQSLNMAVQNALNSLIPTLGFLHQDITDEDIDNLTNQVEGQVENAVRNQQNFFENLWSWLNPDDTIGTKVWKFSSDQLLRENPIPLQKRWSNGYGDWELFGNIDSQEIPQCPAEVVQDVFENLFGRGTSEKSMERMYRFRDNEMQKYHGLYSWWQIAQRNSLYLKSALKDKEVAQAALSIFEALPNILQHQDKPLDGIYFDHAMTVFKHILTLNRKDRHSRKDVKRSMDALQQFKGKSLNELFIILASIRPSRYPQIEQQKKFN